MSFEDWQSTLEELFPSSNVERKFDVATAIYDAYQTGKIKPLKIPMRGTTNREPRTYLGVSGLGEKCGRKVWAQWRLPSSFPGRILRLFATGDIAEERMRHDLQAVGFEIAGDQSRMQAMGGRVKGHTDGFARIDGLPWALFECKSASHKRFTDLKKKMADCREAGEPEGLAIAKWKSAYWTQIHVYMAFFALDVCLYGVVDKNTDQLIFFLVERDDLVVAEAQSRASLVLSEGVPQRAWSRAQTPDCTIFCDHSEWCWYGEPMPVVCGSCTHWRARDGVCTLHKEERAQHDVCGSHEAIDVEATGDDFASMNFI